MPASGNSNFIFFIDYIFVILARTKAGQLSPKNKSRSSTKPKKRTLEDSDHHDGMVFLLNRKNSSFCFLK
jgi:hypothetical protein